MRRKHRIEAKAIQQCADPLEKWTLAASTTLEQFGDVNLCADMLANIGKTNSANEAFIITKMREHAQRGALPRFLRDLSGAVEWKLNPDRGFVAASQLLLAWSETAGKISYNSEKMTAFEVVKVLEGQGVTTTAAQVRFYAKHLGLKLKSAKYGRPYPK